MIYYEKYVISETITSDNQPSQSMGYKVILEIENLHSRSIDDFKFEVESMTRHLVNLAKLSHGAGSSV